MRLQLYGKNAQDISDIAQKLGFEIVNEHPDVLITYGGDGTLLAAERQYPNIPKLPIRDSKVCKKCSEHETNHLLQLLKNDQIETTTQPKLETDFDGNTLIALNDIVIRNKSAYHAIRFFVSKNGQKISPTNPLIIGDGIVASTPFGSTGYYQSITKTTFKENFRIVFNNTVATISPLEFTADDKIILDIVRGPGEMTADNNPETIELMESNQVIIRVSDQTAKIYSPQTLRCNNCEVKREQRLHD
jgi:NAD+ kinase